MAASTTPIWADLWSAALARTPSSAFAFVMATGILSEALHVAGVGRVVTEALLVVAVVGYLLLAILWAARLVCRRSAMVEDARDPQRAFGYFTVVAASGVLTERFAALGADQVAQGFLLVTAVLWILLTYGLPASLMLSPAEKPVLAGIDGSWFLWVVATQALAIGCTVASPGPDRFRLPVAVGLWSIGLILYLILATLILLRLLTVPSDPDSFTPAYWIFMGATAISVLAASRLLLEGGGPVLDDTRAFVAGAAYMLWAFGTWWIPLLVIFGIWRHVVHRRPVTYETGLWSVVFPLGMYAAAGYAASDALGLPFLTWAARISVTAGSLAWLAVTVLMVICGVVRARVAPGSLSP